MDITPRRRRVIFSATALLLAAGVASTALQFHAEAERSNASHPVTVAPLTAPPESAPGKGPGAASTAATPAPAEPGATTSDNPKGSTQPAVPAPGSPAPDVSASGLSVVELAAVEQPVAAPVAFDHPVALASSVEARLGQLEAVDGQAAGIGEVSGPAVRFTVTLANKSSTDMSTNNVVVTANAGSDETPVLQLSGPGATSFTATIPAGQEASATFVFLVPPDLRDQVRIFVNYEAKSPIAAFAGTAPGVKS